jgi:hypothetical protein
LVPTASSTSKEANDAKPSPAPPPWSSIVLAGPKNPWIGRTPIPLNFAPSGAAKAGSPDCLAWPRGTARAFTVLPPDPVRRRDAGFGGRMMSAGNDFIKVGLREHGTRRRLPRRIPVVLDESLNLARRLDLDVLRDFEPVQGNGIAEPDMHLDDVPRVLLGSPRVDRCSLASAYDLQLPIIRGLSLPAQPSDKRIGAGVEHHN